MGKKNIQYASGRYSPWQLLNAANAYYALSEVATAAYPDSAKALAATPVDPGEALASATNRILALELYLKALLVGSSVPVPMVHNLVILFSHLPEATKVEIVSHYEQRCQAVDWTERSVSYILCFQLDVPVDSTAIGETVEATPIDLTLVGLLERNNDGFIDSRYLFQRASANEANSFEYEFQHLAILCKLLRQALEDNLIRVPV